MPKVKFIREKIEIEVPKGANLRKEARKAGIQIYNGLSRLINCRGLSSCGTCRVFIKNDTMKNCSPRTLKERIRLALSFFAIGHEDEVRLSCQTEVMGDIEVHTRPEFNWYGK